MTSEDTLLKKANELGELVADHQAAKNLTVAAEKFKNDKNAQQSIATFNQALQEMSIKKQMGQPIEVTEKKTT